MEPRTLILRVYLITCVCCVVLGIVEIFTFPDSRSIAIPFQVIFIISLLLFAESIVFLFVYIKRLKNILWVLLPVILITSLGPLEILNIWLKNRPADIPKPGKLPVTYAEYNSNEVQVINDYKKTDLNSLGLDSYDNLIKDTYVDTIIYSPNKIEFFAVIMAKAVEGKKESFCLAYRVGRRTNNDWILKSPKGNIWITCFNSIPELKQSVRQYYYEKYSINGSSDKPEIWTDPYIFPFDSNR